MWARLASRVVACCRLRRCTCGGKVAQGHPRHKSGAATAGHTTSCHAHSTTRAAPRTRSNTANLAIVRFPVLLLRCHMAIAIAPQPHHNYKHNYNMRHSQTVKHAATPQPLHHFNHSHIQSLTIGTTAPRQHHHKRATDSPDVCGRQIYGCIPT